MTMVDAATTKLTDGQRTILAVGLARAHELPIVTAIGYADTVADLLATMPPDTVRRCACGCGQRVGPMQHWASQACFRADEDHDREDDLG